MMFLLEEIGVEAAMIIATVAAAAGLRRGVDSAIDARCAGSRYAQRRARGVRARRASALPPRGALAVADHAL